MSTATLDLSAVLLAGGRSRRFGSDKASLIWRGESLLDRGLRELSRVTSHVRVSLPARTDQDPSIWDDARDRGIVIVDDPPGVGPAGGLHAALKTCRSEWLLLLALDLPHVGSTEIRQLLAARCGPSGVVAREGMTDQRPLEGETSASMIHGQVQPAFGLYHSSVLPMVSGRIASGRYSLKGIIDEGDFKVCDFPAHTLTNVNEPRDLPPETHS